MQLARHDRASPLAERASAAPHARLRAAAACVADASPARPLPRGCVAQICIGPVCVPVGALMPTLIVFAHQRGWLVWLQPRWFDWRWYRSLLRRCAPSARDGCAGLGGGAGGRAGVPKLRFVSSRRLTRDAARSRFAGPAAAAPAAAAKAK